LNRESSTLAGVVVVDKPGGMTSHDVVNRLRRIYGTRRVGHAGTLDPIATGVLVVCIGQATRILEYVAATKKRYQAEVLFGVRTDTQDITGRVLTRPGALELRREQVEAALEAFRGKITQIPPMHSAIHHEGKRLYELARKGIEVQREPRQVEIHRLDLWDFIPGVEGRAVIDVECSTGTYIRTLSADIGDAVGTGGLMSALRRTHVGNFAIDDAFTLEQLTTRQESGELKTTIRPMAVALQGWPRVTLSGAETEAVRQGRQIALQDRSNEERVLLLDAHGQIVALARIAQDVIAPEKVFPQGE
jgi:tRNA pseudouridine55 synthase